MTTAYRGQEDACWDRFATLLVGMGHGMEHAATNRRLRRLWHDERLDVQLAYDSQFVPLSLS